MTGFLADRWASAFIGVCGADAAEGLELLKRMAQSLEPAGYIEGTQDARQAEKLIRNALKKSEKADASPFSQRGVETALGTLVLLIRKGFFQYHKRLVEEIGRALDRKNGVLSAVLETFTPLDAVFRKNLERSLLEKTRAREVKISEKIAPELLGGYRIRVGTKVIDASLRSLLRSMAQTVEKN